MNYFIIILSIFVFMNSYGAGKSYTRLEFKRDGGGNKEFFISKSDFKEFVDVNITRYNFKDTSFTIKFSRKELGDDLVKTLSLLLDGRLKISGNYKQSALPTGTWAHFYVVEKNSVKHEILNIKLRDMLFKLENLVGNKLKK